MEYSMLYDLIEMQKLTDYRKELMKDENDGFYKDTIKARGKLEEVLNEEQMKLADKYRHAVGLREEYINFLADIKLLNYGIKIGMELQKAFDEEDSKY